MRKNELFRSSWKHVFVLCAICFSQALLGQSVNGPNGYRVVDVGTNNQGDFTRSLILLHEIFNGQILPFNNAVGTITAFRGSPHTFNRVNIVQVNTSSAYNGVYGAIHSLSSEDSWRLKTCFYSGKKYIALEVPYSASFHDHGFQFAGWTNSSGESLKCVNYMVNDQPINQGLISNIQDFQANLTETSDVGQLNIKGRVGIGTEVADPAYQLQVKGKIRTQEIKVEVQNWPDYVFNSAYELQDLNVIEQFINKNKHLPGIPSALEVAEKGVDLGEMNRNLLQKIEELTLHIIEQNKRLEKLEEDKK